VSVPLLDLIDVEGELERLRRELNNALSERSRAEARIANASFVERAPDDVVQRERDKASDWERVAEQTRSEIAELEDLVGEPGGA
jgi:valyl-tRNA synthetase